MADEPTSAEFNALADEYQAGLDRSVASGYEEFYGPDFRRRHSMVVTALRAYAVAHEKFDRIDMVKYVKEKAEKIGLIAREYPPETNSDISTIRLLSTKKPDIGALISFSGLEEIQNSSAQAARDLLDGRFEVARASLKRMGGL